MQDEESEEEDDAYEPTDVESEEESDDDSEYDSEASDASDGSGDSEGISHFSTIKNDETSKPCASDSERQTALNSVKYYTGNIALQTGIE